MAWDRDDTELWKAYRKKPTPENRNAIIEHHMPMATKLTAKAYDRFRGLRYEFDDYLGWAVIGLIKAVENFDENRGNKFCTYAWYCVESQILTGLNTANGYHYSNIEKKEFVQGTKCIDFLEETLGVDDETPFDASEQAKFALSLLRGRDKRIVRSYYFEGKTMPQIGAKEKITRERVRQILNRALRVMRNSLGAKKVEPSPSLKGRYPWHEWANGEVWVVKQGVDFDSTCNALRAAIRFRAKSYGRNVHVSVRGDEVLFQFYGNKTRTRKHTKLSKSK